MEKILKKMIGYLRKKTDTLKISIYLKIYTFLEY